MPVLLQPSSPEDDAVREAVRGAGLDPPADVHASADYRRHLSRSQFRNPARVQPVFITKWKIMQQVADSVNSLAGKNLSDARTNALHILNRGGEFEHALRLRVA